MRWPRRDRFAQTAWDIAQPGLALESGQIRSGRAHRFERHFDVRRTHLRDANADHTRRFRSSVAAHGALSEMARSGNPRTEAVGIGPRAFLREVSRTGKRRIG